MNISHAWLQPTSLLEVCGGCRLDCCRGTCLTGEGSGLYDASWVDGHAVIMGCDDPTLTLQRTGDFALVFRDGNPFHESTFCNFHFAIPTPVIMNGNRLRIVQALIDYGIENDHPQVIRVFDGQTMLTQLTSYLNFGKHFPYLTVPIPGEPF